LGSMQPRTLDVCRTLVFPPVLDIAWRAPTKVASTRRETVSIRRRLCEGWKQGGAEECRCMAVAAPHGLRNQRGLRLCGWLSRRSEIPCPDGLALPRGARHISEQPDHSAGSGLAGTGWLEQTLRYLSRLGGRQEEHAGSEQALCRVQVRPRQATNRILRKA